MNNSIIGLCHIDEDGNDTLQYAEKALIGMPGSFEKVLYSALNRAATSGTAKASQLVSKEYIISAADFKKYTQKKKTVSTSGGRTEIGINFAGKHISLTHFDVSVTKRAGVSARVKRNGSKNLLHSVFMAQSKINAHVGLFERRTTERFPIEEKKGPSVPQMMSANPVVNEGVAEQITKVFDERLLHEVTAVLNGWRK